MSNFRTAAKQQNVKMGQLLKTLRNNKKVTMRALAAELGTPHSFIGKIEQQSRRMDVGEFTCYIRALGADPVEVFTQLMQIMEEEIEVA